MNDAQTAVTKKTCNERVICAERSRDAQFGRLYINIKLQYQFDWMICFILPTRPFSSFTLIP